MDSFEVFNALIDGIFDEMKTVRMVHNRHWIFFSMKKKDKKKDTSLQILLNQQF